MTTRGLFEPDEWEILRQTPFWLRQMLCAEAAPENARAAAEFLRREIGEPRFFPPFPRIVFRSALADDPKLFDVVPLPDVWARAAEILRRRATTADAAQFQMSLASVGRNLIKQFGEKLNGRDTTHLPPNQIASFRLEQVWRELGFENYQNGLVPNAAIPWQRDLQLAPMRVWFSISMLDGAISAEETEILQNPAYQFYPPYDYFLLADTQRNLNAYYAVAAADSKLDSFAFLEEAGKSADANLSVGNAQIFKMSLLWLARDAAEANAARSLSDNSFATLIKVADALNLYRPSKEVAPPITENVENNPKKEKPSNLPNQINYLSEKAAEQLMRVSNVIRPSVKNFLDQTINHKSPSTNVKNEAPMITNDAEIKTPENNVSETSDAPGTIDAQLKNVPDPSGENAAAQSPPAPDSPLPPIPAIAVEEKNAVSIDEEPISAGEQIEASEIESEINLETADSPISNEPGASAMIVMPEIDLGVIEREVAESLPDSLDSFADYKKTIAAVNGDLRQLLETADELKMDNAAALIKDMMRRVEDNSFSIAVVGEFKRGKSTFINALLGKDILPSDILPCSATLNRVTYGIKPNVLVKYKDGREESVEIDKLPDYVTKLTEESEELASTIKEAIVTYPIPYCQNNVEIIDTPGLNDDANMTDVTLSVLPHVDAAILVIMANSPFSEYERDFLENKLLTSDLGRVIFLVTAIDRLNNPEKDADRVVKAIRDRIRKHVMKRAAEQFGAESEEYEVYLRKIGEPRVFPVSPYQALQAKQNNDEALMTLSRFKEFETALEKFLSEDRGAVFLQVPVNRLLSAAHDVMSAFKIREGALSMQKGDFDAAHQKTLQEIEVLRQRKESEMKKVDAAARAVEADIKPLILQLDDIIRQTAADVIDNADISETDLGNQNLTTQKVQFINEKIQAEIQSASKAQLEKIQLQVQRGITAEAMRWGDFSEAMANMTHGIENRFGAPQIGANENVITQGAGILATLTGLGGVYTGYQVAGWKGAATGGAASIGVGIGTAIALTVVAGTILALPVLIVGTLLALPAGSWLTRQIFGNEKVKNFREQLKKQTLETIEQQLVAGGVEGKIIAEIDNAFGNLKDKIHTEVEATLNDTEKTLTELRSKRERDEILSETEMKQLFKMKRETLKIQVRAEKLNNLLLQIMTA